MNSRDAAELVDSNRVIDPAHNCHPAVTTGNFASGGDEAALYFAGMASGLLVPLLGRLLLSTVAGIPR